MAQIAKSGVPSLAVVTPGPEHRLSSQVAGEAIGAFDACYKASDGKWYRSTGVAANAAAKIRGYAAQAYASGDTDMTLYHGVRVRYGAGLAPGTSLFLSDTVPGGFADTATTGGTTSCGWVVDDTRVELWRTQ